MTWVKLDTGYLANPKLRGISDKAILLHLSSILWTADHGTDGNVPSASLRTVASRVTGRPERARRWANELVANGLWDLNGDGWHVHDFEVHNRQALRANVEANRAANAERLRRFREQQRHYAED